MAGRRPALRARRPHGASHVLQAVAALGLLVGITSPARAAPWRTAITPHFALRYPPALGARAPDWERRAERAYAAVSDRLELRPPGRIPLYLYAQHRDFRAAAGLLPHDMVVGISQEEDGLIRIDASNTFASAEITLRHEIVHSILARGLGARIHDLPLWMNEGLAQTVDQPDDPDLEEQARQSRSDGTFHGLSDLSVEFPHGDAEQSAYAEAYSATRYFVERFGWRGLDALIQSLKAGRGFTESFHVATGDPLASFYTEWEDSLVRRGWLAWLQAFSVPLSGLAMIWACWAAYRTVGARRRRIELEDEGESCAGPIDAEPETGAEAGGPTCPGTS